MKGVTMQCIHCRHDWNYTGSAPYGVTCPACKKKTPFQVKQRNEYRRSLSASRL